MTIEQCLPLMFWLLLLLLLLLLVIPLINLWSSHLQVKLSGIDGGGGNVNASMQSYQAAE